MHYLTSLGTIKLLSLSLSITPKQSSLITFHSISWKRQTSWAQGTLGNGILADRKGQSAHWEYLCLPGITSCLSQVNPESMDLLRAGDAGKWSPGLENWEVFLWSPWLPSPWRQPRSSGPPELPNKQGAPENQCYVCIYSKPREVYFPEFFFQIFWWYSLSSLWRILEGGIKQKS